MDPQPAPPEPLADEAFALALLEGVLAAIVGGFVWGLVVKWTGYEFGFLAWGIGLLVAVAIRTRRRPQARASCRAWPSCSALLGILIGKYLGFAFAVQASQDA